MKVGDAISIPKGTQVFDYMNARHEGDITKRAARGTVKNLFTMNWTDFVNWDYRDSWMRKGYTRQWPLPDNMPLIHPEVIAEKTRIDAMLGGDYSFVSWGNRYAHVAAVLPDEVKKGKEAPVSKRTYMVKGSRWRFMKDVTITALVHPTRDSRLTKELAQWVADGSPCNYDEYHRYFVEVPIFTVSAGTDFEVTSDKTTSGHDQRGAAIRTDLVEDQVELHIKYPRGDGSTGGRGMPTWQYWGENPWWNGDYRLPISQIEDFVEALEVPETLIYLLKDTVTGQYFAGFHEDYSARPPKFELHMADTVKSAKKFVNPSNAKASIMNWTGYLDGMGVHGNVNSDKKADLPSTWVLCPVNKITLVEGNPIDVQKWYQELVRLRSITVEYGSAIRALYKKLDGGNDYDTLVAISQNGEWDTGDKILKEIDLAAKESGDPIMRTKGSSSVAFACSLTDGMLLKLKFHGSHGLKVGLLDRTTLDEIVAPD